MKRKSFLFILLSLVLLTGCSTEKKTIEQKIQVIEHIEAFTIENYADKPNPEGIREINGYRKVNSIVQTEESSRSPKRLKIYEISDYHNNDGKFVYSLIRYSETNKNTKQKIENKPMTVLSTDNIPPTPPKELTEKEKKQVKEHVLNISSTFLNIENKK